MTSSPTPKARVSSCCGAEYEKQYVASVLFRTVCMKCKKPCEIVEAAQEEVEKLPLDIELVLKRLGRELDSRNPSVSGYDLRALVLHCRSLQQHSEALAGAMQEWMTHHNQSSVADCECAKCTLIREALAKYRIAFPSPQTHE